MACDRCKHQYTCAPFGWPNEIKESPDVVLLDTLATELQALVSGCWKCSMWMSPGSIRCNSIAKPWIKFELRLPGSVHTVAWVNYQLNTKEHKYFTNDEPPADSGPAKYWSKTTDTVSKKLDEIFARLFQ